MHCNEGLLFPGRPEPTQARQVFGRAMNLVTSQQDKFDREVDRRATPPCRGPSLILPSCKQGLSAPTQAGTAIIAERFPPRVRIVTWRISQYRLDALRKLVV